MPQIKSYLSPLALLVLKDEVAVSNEFSLYRMLRRCVVLIKSTAEVSSYRLVSSTSPSLSLDEFFPQSFLKVGVTVLAFSVLA